MNTISSPKIQLISYRFVSFAEWVLHFVLFGLSLCVRPFFMPDRLNKSVLLCRLDSIGDIILFTACLPAYRRLFPEYHITLLVTEEVREIITGCPFVDEIWFLDKKRFRRSVPDRLRWWQKLLVGRFEIAINPVYSNNFPFLDCIIGWTGSGRRIAHRCLDIPGGRKRSFPFYSELAPVEVEWKFEIDRNFDLLRYLGYRGETAQQTWIWRWEDVDSVHIDRDAGDEPFIVVCPGSRVKAKMWPLENYVAVMKYVSKHRRVRWLVCGDDSEVSLCAKIAADVGDDAVNLAGHLTLGQLADIISAAEMCLGNDSAPLHLAVARGVTGICILGGGHHQRFYPYPGNPGTIAIDHRLSCYHCHWKCILNEPECVMRVSVEKVAETVLRVLSSSTKIREAHVAV